MANHLWQSTLFAALAWLLTLTLRKQQAKIRHAVWLAASIKFVIPFSLLLSLGTRVPVAPASPIIPALVVEQMTMSLAPVPMEQRSETSQWPQAVWIAGALLLAVRWGKRWLILRRGLQSAKPLAIDAPIPVRSTTTMIEPGVFGLFRPVLLLPTGIADRLSTQQLDAVLAHELVHVRRRDNLTSAFHMAVETVFWFHPLVWWIGSKLVEERERACDEAVLAEGRGREVYAQAIVNVCKFYVESPLVCAAGVSGADLRQRIEEIMVRRLPIRLTWLRASILAAIAGTVIAMPLMIGILRAQTLPPAPKYRFEEASIRPAPPGAKNGGMAPGPQGGLRATNMTPVQLIVYAYGVYGLHEDQLTGAPKWATTDLFSITGTPDTVEALGPGLSPAQFEEHHSRQRQRMQSLLRDRFGLVLRAETKEMTVFALVVAKGGPKLTPSPEQRGAPTMRMQKERMSGTAAPMKLVADALSRQVGREVVDETGLPGFFDVSLTWTPEGQDGGPSLFTAVQEQLGLRLESKKRPVTVFVVEKLERPSEN